MKIKCTEEERQFLLKHFGEDIVENQPWDRKPEDPEFSNCISEKLDDLIIYQGLTDDQNFLNEFGIIAQSIYDSLFYQNCICEDDDPMPVLSEHVQKIVGRLKKCKEIFSFYYKGKFGFIDSCVNMCGYYFDGEEGLTGYVEEVMKIPFIDGKTFPEVSEDIENCEWTPRKKNKFNDLLT